MKELPKDIKVTVGSIQLDNLSKSDAMWFEYGFRSELSLLARTISSQPAPSESDDREILCEQSAEDMGRSVARSIMAGLADRQDSIIPFLVGQNTPLSRIESCSE